MDEFFLQLHVATPMYASYKLQGTFFILEVSKKICTHACFLKVVCEYTILYMKYVDIHLFLSIKCNIS